MTVMGDKNYENQNYGEVVMEV